MVIIPVIMIRIRLICHQSLNPYHPHSIELSNVSNRYRNQNGGMNTYFTLPNVFHRFPKTKKSQRIELAAVHRKFM